MGQKGKQGSVELQLGQEITLKLRQGVGIKHWNIDCICDSETLGAVCVQPGCEKQWVRLSWAQCSRECERTGGGSALSLCH